MGMSELEIEGRFTGERYRFGDCGIGSIVLGKDTETLVRKHGLRHRTITVKGDYEPDDLQPGLSYKFFGSIRSYKNKTSGLTEKQFHFRSWIPVVVHDEEGVVAYLCNAGRGCGLGIATARKAWAEWGTDAVKVVRENPRELLSLNRQISDEQLREIGRRLEEQQATESATIELTALLQGRGFPKKLPRKCIKAWGNEAAQVIRKDPYRLMRFRGCGFKMCDALYLQLGLDPTRLRRQALCGWYAIASDTSGDCWFPLGVIRQAIKGNIGSRANLEGAVELGERLGRLSPDHYGAITTVRTAGKDGPLAEYGDTVWVAEGRKAAQEESLAAMVERALAESRPIRLADYEEQTFERLSIADHVRCHRCSRQLTASEVHVWNGLPFGPTCIQAISDGEGVEIHPLQGWLESHPQVERIVRTAPKRIRELPEVSLWPEVDTLEVDTHQRERLGDALLGRIAILGGSPGTGKTYTVAQLVLALLATGLVGLEDIAIGAPTGKAAVRVTENLNACGLPIRARTWHSLLGVGDQDEESGGYTFRFNQANPWKFKVIIGDESSMIDTSLMHAIFAARPRGCHMLLVGDINQLPPVGHGAPLRDMIAAGVPYGELTEIKRNSGGIVEACAAIRDGKPWGKGDNLTIINHGEPSVQMETVEAILEQCAGDGMNPVWDCQVLVAVNARSKVSRKAVNTRLQEVLNSQRRIAGSPFCKADKIVCTKNGYYPLLDPSAAGHLEDSMLDSDGRVYVANGELARVLEVEPNRMIASLENPNREIVIPRAKSKSSEGDDEDAATGCSFDLAYSLSCHKSQGSEWPVVIIVLDEYPGARQICDRSWIYTAISRAKEKCFLVGRKTTADAMVRRNNIGRRKTFLRERIQLRRAERELEVI